MSSTSLVGIRTGYRVVYRISLFLFDPLKASIVQYQRVFQYGAVSFPPEKYFGSLFFCRVISAQVFLILPDLIFEVFYSLEVNQYLFQIVFKFFVFVK